MIFNRARPVLITAAVLFAVTACGSDQETPSVATPATASAVAAPAGGTDDRKATCATVTKAMTDWLTSLLTADGDGKAAAKAFTEMQAAFADSAATAADPEVKSALADAGAALGEQLKAADPTEDTPEWRAAAAKLEKVCPRGA